MRKLLIGILAFLLSSSALAGSLANISNHNFYFTGNADVTQSLPAIPLNTGVNSGVVVTNGSGTASASTTLPSGLTIPGYLQSSGGSLSGTVSLTPASSIALDFNDGTYSYLFFNTTANNPSETVSVASNFLGPQQSAYFTFNSGAIYNSTGSLTASQSGTTVTGIGTTFPVDCAHGYIFWPQTGDSAYIISRDSATQLTVLQSQTISAAKFKVYRDGNYFGYAGLGMLSGSPVEASNIDAVPADPTLRLGQNNATGVTIYQTLNMNSKRINSVLDPSSAQDAVTKNYADTTFPTKTGAGASGNWNINSSTVTTNANLTGSVVTSVGNATSITNASITAAMLASTSGSGSIALTTSPAFTTPSLGAATITSANGLTVPSGASGILAATTGTTSWTPGISFSGGTTGIAYGVQNGKYRKTCTTSASTSCQVDFSADVLLTNKGSSTGNATLTGFPVTAGTSAATYTFSCVGSNVSQGAGLNIFGFMNTSATTANISTSGTGVVIANLANTQVNNNSEFRCYGTYFTD